MPAAREGGLLSVVVAAGSRELEDEMGGNDRQDCQDSGDYGTHRGGDIADDSC